MTYGTYVLVTDASAAKDLRHLRPSLWPTDYWFTTTKGPTYTAGPVAHAVCPHEHMRPTHEPRQHLPGAPCGTS